jgi:hypothetical protein
LMTVMRPDAGATLNELKAEVDMRLYTADRVVNSRGLRRLNVVSHLRTINRMRRV